MLRSTERAEARLLLDTSTEFGARVSRRLREDRVIWLTTVRADLTPQPSPVWFFWDGQTFLIYSQPNQQKLRNIQHNPKVALHLDGDGMGGNIVVFTGQARVAIDARPANEVDEYVQKYRRAIARIGMTPESFAHTYSVPLQVTPTKLRGH
jgi:PPOX class probable F420-dependent enzyme